MPQDLYPYDALLLVSFGGPERPEDVIPFLQNVTRGRDIPVARLEEVGEHYFSFGGRSPINDQCRALLAAVREDLAQAGFEISVYWGNRNWDPYLTDTLARMRSDGVRRAACLLTSAYASYSGCRQYREDLYEAVAPLGPDAPRLDRLRHYFNHPGFVRPFVDSTVDALAELEPGLRDDARVVFVTHSIPVAMNEASGLSGVTDGGAYDRQHRDVARTVSRAVAQETGAPHPWDLVYCSRSGPPSVPWLEPDVNDHLENLAASGVRAVVVVPIGFVSDHMEVIFDLDTQARATAEKLDLAFARASTPGTDPRFVSMVRQLVTERAETERAETERAAGRDADPPARPVAGALPAGWDACPADCCANLRGARPALCGVDS